MSFRGTAILIGVVVGIIAFIGAISLSIWCCVHRAKQRARLLQRAEIARARGVAVHTQGKSQGGGVHTQGTGQASDRPNSG